MANVCVYTFVVLLAGTISVGHAGPRINVPIPSSLKLVGSSSDGKDYYAEMDPTRSWFEAKDFCKSENMQLASVTTTAQYEALRVAPSSSFGGDTWTSGRDAVSVKQFTWLDTRNTVEEFPAITFQRVFPQQQCLTIQAAESLNSFYRNYGCGVKFGTLCEVQSQNRRNNPK